MKRCIGTIANNVVTAYVIGIILKYVGYIGAQETQATHFDGIKLYVYDVSSIAGHFSI